MFKKRKMLVWLTVVTAYTYNFAKVIISSLFAADRFINVLETVQLNKENMYI